MVIGESIEYGVSAPTKHQSKLQFRQQAQTREQQLRDTNLDSGFCVLRQELEVERNCYCYENSV